MEQQEKKKGKRRVKQLYFGKRDTRLWEWVQSLPEGEGNDAICQILNHYLFGGMKPEIASYWDDKERTGVEVRERKKNAPEGAEKVRGDATDRVDLMGDMLK